uniref:Acetyl-coenzyme A carboxylase carboxyl transferase subunit alpha n=1 Tax=Gronococcus sybilensis TaxID=3028029 RepID=A0A9Y1I2G4_9RHOD|nr:acetyl-CoA carboxylase carboxyltransferase alphasubunit [Gronococcus sybilensis]
MKQTIVLDFERPILNFENQVKKLSSIAVQHDIDINSQIRELKKKITHIRREIFKGLTPEQKLQLARHPSRPTTLDYINGITDKWIELHGDRRGFDDPAMIVGIGKIDSQPVALIGHQKGRNTKENIARNFGMPSPGGYRKVLRLLQHADRFNLPILTFIDTPGAWAGVEAEKLGQGEAIASNLREFFAVTVPVISTIIGEGGSGGALGIGVADHLIMLENSVYTVATPEACASILWKSASEASAAAEALKITAQDLSVLGIADEILTEPLGGAHHFPQEVVFSVKESLKARLHYLNKLSREEIKARRYKKFRQIGFINEN